MKNINKKDIVSPFHYVFFRTSFILISLVLALYFSFALI